jgi:CheY-like chemotaxis protein
MQHESNRAILIADDDRDIVAILSFRCRRLGLNVLNAFDAFTALTLVKAHAPDVICLDVEMPSGNGLSVCEMLMADDACRSIPIIILTGNRDHETIIRCHSMCVYYVEKCSDVWSRIEPLLNEVLPASAASSHSISSHSTAQRNVREVAPKLASTP